MALTERRYMKFLFLAVGSALTGLTLILPWLGLLEWLTLVPVCMVLLTFASDPSVRLRRLYGLGLFSFFCYYLVTFHWFVNLYPLSFIDGMTKGGALAVVLVAWLGLSLLQALFGGLLFVLCGLVFRTGLARRHPFLKPFLSAGLWAVYEWTQTLGWWGVPWGRLPLGQSAFPVGLQLASLLGPYCITFLLVAVNGCVAYALLTWWREREHAPRMLATRYASLAVAVMLTVQYGAGAILWMTGAPDEEAETVTVAAVQGNIASGEKWSFASTKKTREIYRRYTLLAAEEGARIVVWPETAYPWTVEPGSGYYDELCALATEANVTILVGAFSEAEQGEYNALIAFLPDGTTHDTVYAKRRLVPFGEFVPLRSLIELLIPPLADLVMSGEDVAWGEDPAVIELEEGAIGSLICFDSIYEDLTRDSVLDGAELICLSTNDSWFTDSAALYMHNAQAQLRAIESGRYVVRAANTGISTVISSRGEVLEQLEPLVDGMIVREVPLQSRITLYSRIGNLLVYLLILLYLAVLGTDLWLRRKEKSRENL